MSYNPRSNIFAGHNIMYVFCNFSCGLNSVQLIQVGEMFGGFAY